MNTPNQYAFMNLLVAIRTWQVETGRVLDNGADALSQTSGEVKRSDLNHANIVQAEA